MFFFLRNIKQFSNFWLIRVANTKIIYHGKCWKSSPSSLQSNLPKNPPIFNDFLCVFILSLISLPFPRCGCSRTCEVSAKTTVVTRYQCCPEMSAMTSRTEEKVCVFDFFRFVILNHHRNQFQLLCHRQPWISWLDSISNIRCFSKSPTKKVTDSHTLVSSNSSQTKAKFTSRSGWWGTCCWRKAIWWQSKMSHCLSQPSPNSSRKVSTSLTSQILKLCWKIAWGTLLVSPPVIWWPSITITKFMSCACWKRNLDELWRLSSVTWMWVYTFCDEIELKIHVFLGGVRCTRWIQGARASASCGRADGSRSSTIHQPRWHFLHIQRRRNATGREENQRRNATRTATTAPEPICPRCTRSRSQHLWAEVWQKCPTKRHLERQRPGGIQEVPGRRTKSSLPEAITALKKHFKDQWKLWIFKIFIYIFHKS